MMALGTVVFLVALTTVTADLAPRAYTPLRLGTVQPRGWVLDQLVRQANSLSGYMSKSTFPGADHVNKSLWVGGDGSKQGGNSQWLPYWTNGNVPLVALIRGAGATDRLDQDLGLADTIDSWMDYVLKHTNKTNGWIGPYMNEPGDGNGHGLWDPLNMVRSLMMWAEENQQQEARVAAAVVAHLTQEAHLLQADPVIKWASTRWPTFVEISHYVIDHYVPQYGNDKVVMPLGGSATSSMLQDACHLFRQKGMDWSSYYHQTAPKKFPETDVKGWNTIDHGVNNAEGALNWPATAYRMTGNASEAWELNTVLSMMDKWQGQIQSLFCADEVFCGREPHRGTETCAVVEAMASLEHSFIVMGNASLMDYVERLAFNALPAALTGDMWTHVYVQQSNSVFAGNTKPAPWQQPGRGSKKCGRDKVMSEDTEKTCARAPIGDTPSGEDEGSNFFGVSHFPCCITNFPQGWPKFAMHAIVADTASKPPAAVIASLIPASATMPSSIGGGALIVTDSQYPFSDSATITVTAHAPMQLKIRIPGWASSATMNGQQVANGTFAVLHCSIGQTVARLELNPEIRLEYGWGGYGNATQAPVNGVGVVRGPLVFAFHPSEHRKVARSYENFPPARALAVDYEISTNDTWNYGLVPHKGLRFVRSPSVGWNVSFPFSDAGEFPFSITVAAQEIKPWGYWQGSKITDVPPPSPFNCGAQNCGDEVELRLVPFGSTNIRVSVFPWVGGGEQNSVAAYV